jgi:biopolymer transport protein ExbB
LTVPTSVFVLHVLGQEPAPGTGASTGRTLMDYIAEGGFIGAILIGLSFVAVTLVIYGFIRFRREAWAPHPIVEALAGHLRENDIDSARAFCAHPDNECFLTRVVGAALERCSRSAFGFLELRNALEEAGHVETDRQYRINDGLQLIAALGPMLGLLGTVIGLIGAFGTLADLEGVARSKQLASFMSLALVNTAEGLAVAIPATTFYFFFKRRIDRLATEVAQIVETIALPLEQRRTDGKPVPRSQGRPAPPRVSGASVSTSDSPRGGPAP